MSAPYPRPHRDMVTDSIASKRRYDRVMAALCIFGVLALVGGAAYFAAVHS